MKTDLDIAREIKLRPIVDVAKDLGISEDDLELYGKFKAKLPLHLIDEKKMSKSKLIFVTAMTATPAGEGKTTVSVGLTQGLNKIGKKSMAVLREPSLGPVFGVKGGATGGGYSQVLPMEDINLHFTGDISAVEKAHNLLAAMIDNNIQNKKTSIGIDPRTVRFPRVMDMNERALRKIIVGLGGTTNGVPRETGFDITAASEVMAILCLSKNISDLKEKLGNIFVGYTYDNKPVYARDLKANGAMAVLLKDAIKPNLVQTTEGTPAIIHGGPFANIAHGCNTIIATKMGLSLSDYVVTEGGFGSDLGAEKFMDIKCHYAGISPQVIVIVATIRALKYHGGVDLKELKKENTHAVEAGFENLEKHIENMRCFKVEPIVAINKFVSDSDKEIEVVIKKCKEMGAKVVVADVWAKGGEGTIDLAKAVVEIIDDCKNKIEPLYKWDWSVEDKINKIATTMYGADGVEYTSKAKKDIKDIIKLGLDKLPVCIAKTQKSLSDDEKRLGRPRNYTLTVREIQISSGAGFIVPITGDIMRMPGLPGIPAAEKIDIDADGNISGLF